MFAQSDTLFTGQLVFGLTALLGLVSLGVKIFARKPKAEDHYLARDEFHDFRREIERDLENLRTRLDHSFERILQRLDEHKTEMLTAHDQRTQTLQQQISELQAQVARLDERTNY